MKGEIDPHELSGLLDDELPPDRALYVRQAIDADPALQAQLKRFAQLDRAWSLAAAKASFKPNVAASSAVGLAPLAAGLFSLVILVALRFGSKLTTALGLAVTAHIVVLVVLVLALVWLSQKLSGERLVLIEG
jgi:anti-sigma factor RsiW